MIGRCVWGAVMYFFLSLEPLRVASDALNSFSSPDHPRTKVQGSIDSSLVLENEHRRGVR